MRLKNSSYLTRGSRSVRLILRDTFLKINTVGNFFFVSPLKHCVFNPRQVDDGRVWTRTTITEASP